jgi:penicillin-binding protein-related factor A (putative recombinase)
MKESSQKKLFLDFCKANNIEAQKFFGAAGTPDIIGCCKGEYFGLEFKQGHSADSVLYKVTEIQLRKGKEIMLAGGRVFYVSLSKTKCCGSTGSFYRFEFNTFESFCTWFLSLFGV